MSVQRPEYTHYKDRADHFVAERNRLIERAKYFIEKEDINQAIANYADSLVAESQYLKWQGQWCTLGLGQPIMTSPLTPFTAQVLPSQLLGLYRLLSRISECYSANLDHVKTAFLRDKLILIAKELSEYQKYFDVEMLKEFEEMESDCSKYQSYVEKHKDEIVQLLKLNKKQQPDESFFKIREALNDMSSTDLCPVSLNTGTGDCFIATAVYLTANHPDLDTFRAFRDQKLLINPLGKLLVSIYYKVGPSLALYIGNDPILKQFTHQQLIKLANWMRQKKIIS